MLERHPQIGYQMLESLGVDPVAECVLHHHERWDGDGYPDGFGAEDIPLGARIIFVADAFDAMTSDRVYRARLSDGRGARGARAQRRHAVRPRRSSGGARPRSSAWRSPRVAWASDEPLRGTRPLGAHGHLPTRREEDHGADEPRAAPPPREGRRLSRRAVRAAAVAPARPRHGPQPGRPRRARESSGHGKKTADKWNQ